MESIIISSIAGAASIIALIVSLYNAATDKRRLVTETITKNRIEWLKEIRDMLAAFADAYRLRSHDKMESINDKLELFLNRKNQSYIKLLKAVNMCLQDDSFSLEHRDELIICSQKVLTDTWTRMKREAGIKKETEDKFLKEFFKEFF